MRFVVIGLVVLAASSVGACSGARERVSFVSNEQPNGNYNGQGTVSKSAAHQESPNGGASRTMDLGEDDLIEPEHPAAATKQERALVHIHGAKRVCSGVVLAPKLVATAQRCLREMPKGILTLQGPEQELRVEVASSAMTWTNRRARYAVIPGCEEGELDVALLVLEEAVPSFVAPLSIVSAPDVGARVQALGFGHCPGSKERMTEKVGAVRSRVSESIVIDVPLCRGDAGGPVIDGNAGEVIGVISRRDNPVDSPLKTTAIARLDTGGARRLLDLGKALVDGGDAAKLKPVTCR